MRWHLPIVLLFFLGSCNSGTPEAPPNRWADERLWPVLEAQEYRDTDALCALLKDDAAEVREAAALAFASVQDTLGIPCLLAALRDDLAAVRATVVFALGFVADSLTIERMAEQAMNESDAPVQRAYLSASFLAMQRKGMLKDPNAIIYFLQSSNGQDRVRAADALRRLPDSVLAGMEQDYLRLVEEEQDVEVKAMLVRGMGVFNGEHVITVLRVLLGSEERMLRSNALKALGRTVNGLAEADLQHALQDTCVDVRYAAVEAMRSPFAMDGDSFIRIANTSMDFRVQIELLGLAVRHKVPGARAHLERLERKTTDPYSVAAILEAMLPELRQEDWDTMIDLLTRDEHPAIRQTALAALLKEAVSPPIRADFTNVPRLKPIVETVFRTRDPGLIAALMEGLLTMGDDGCSVSDLAELLPQGVVDELTRTMHPIRDLEARLLIDQVAAKRDGLPPPPHTPPPFNHPINKEKLRALPQGQRYRITTTKGEIIIATDVNETPGSSLAFDSLVTAGYYNGKAFHRMVPNFVVQGGCPRGDGYGGMDWTLRTEIGRKLFTAGSVGLASAGRDTESCQFFITHSATPHLDGRYTRFGEVVEGMDVVWRLQVGDVMERVERMP